MSLGNRLTVGHNPLEVGIGVRIPVPQPAPAIMTTPLVNKLAKILNSSLIKYFFIPLILFLTLVLNYQKYQSVMTISYYDEITWVGRSYFFDFFYNKDFDNRIWKSIEAYDQPNLTYYVYGAWLYPQYLDEKRKVPQTYDYTQFLIDRGLYEVDESYLDKYAEYKMNSTVRRFDESQDGTPEEWVSKYGPESLKTVNLIQDARSINVLLLALSVVVLYYLFLRYKGLMFALLFSVLYGLNILIIDVSLKAHSEAVFLFMFNCAFASMIYYFKQRKLIYLVAFYVLSGLALSTKLNGIILIPTFLLIDSLLLIFFLIDNPSLTKNAKNKIKTFLRNLSLVVLPFAVFVIFNPFLHKNTIKNIELMYSWRASVAAGQAKYNLDTKIKDSKELFTKVFDNFYFSNSYHYYNGIKGVEKLTDLSAYNYLLFLMAIVGLIHQLKKSAQRSVFSFTIIISFVVCFMFIAIYLRLNWPRYFAPLSLFILLFQAQGIASCLSYVFKIMRAN